MISYGYGAYFIIARDLDLKYRYLDLSKNGRQLQIL